jgi:cytoskeletal protein RodZ
MNSVGRTLRSARERQSRDLSEIADELCLTQRYVRAIEEDDVKSLPGAFFYKNFVRQYAAILGVKESDCFRRSALAASIREPVQPGALAQSPVRHGSHRRGPTRYFAHTRLGMSVAGLALALLACSGSTHGGAGKRKRPGCQAHLCLQ